MLNTPGGAVEQTVAPALEAAHQAGFTLGRTSTTDAPITVGAAQQEGGSLNSNGVVGRDA